MENEILAVGSAVKYVPNAHPRFAERTRNLRNMVSQTKTGTVTQITYNNDNTVHMYGIMGLYNESIVYLYPSEIV